jgi:hypothetical protein
MLSSSMAIAFVTAQSFLDGGDRSWRAGTADSRPDLEGGHELLMAQRRRGPDGAVRMRPGSPGPLDQGVVADMLRERGQVVVAVELRVL